MVDKFVSFECKLPLHVLFGRISVEASTHLQQHLFIVVELTGRGSSRGRLMAKA
jgi:hypothetical protein